MSMTMRPPYLQNLIGITAALGSIGVFLIVRKLLNYVSYVLSAGIYTGKVYDEEYEGGFDPEVHTHFTTPPNKDAGRELEILRDFICKEVIPKFKDHHEEESGGRHFVVLILLADSLSSLADDWKFKPLTESGQPYVDPSHLTRPPRQLYGNYIVAHPQRCSVNHWLTFLNFIPKFYYKHAEEILLGEFDILHGKFRTEENREAECIILFSWLFPCDWCTSDIINRFGCGFRVKNPAVQRVVIVFAIYWRRIPFQRNWRNFLRLKENGFDIVRIKL